MYYFRSFLLLLLSLHKYSLSYVSNNHFTAISTNRKSHKVRTDPRRQRLVRMGCDTFVAYPPTTPEGLIIFGKNSDRPAGEGQSIRRYPSQIFPTDDGNSKVMVQCTYISIPQAPKIHAVLLSQIDWMWGAEMGANEHGVVIGKSYCLR
mmetsp:Transcript_7034/g.10068  ORF Transcript_7034/g.10068 Transcript_7034/m.10068 type:complete len:149 (-) Transcript_7034:820-1266(-)